MVKYLQHHIPELVAVVQKEDDSPMNTFLNSCRVAGTGPRIHFEDDCLLTKDFVSKARSEIEERPNSVIQFFSRRKKDLEGDSYFIAGAAFNYNVAFYLPPDLSEALIDFWNSPNSEWTEWDRNDGPTSFDIFVARYLQTNKMSYYNVIPNLVEHSQTISAVNSSRPQNRQSKTFIDPEMFMYPYAMPTVTKQRIRALEIKEKRDGS